MFLSIVYFIVLLRLDDLFHYNYESISAPNSHVSLDLALLSVSCVYLLSTAQ